MARTAATSQALRENFAHCISTDRERFDRAPLPYPFKFEQQVDEFAAAVQVAVDGEVVRACNLIISMDHEPLVKWFDTLAQNAGRERVRFLGNTPQHRRGGGTRDMRISRVRTIAERDGWRCGYCNIRVVEPRVLRKIDALLGGKVLRHLTEKRSNRSYHGVWLLMALTLDHIEPLAEHHDDSDANLVTCCWACNFGKYHYTLDELGLQHPRQGLGPRDVWRGLTDLV